jgi:nitrile hydratase subunit beta
MNGVHDLGGTDGFGPLVIEADEPAFHAEWEKAVFAMLFTTMVTGHQNVYQFLSYMEEMHPVEYLASRYYEHWLYTIERHVVRTGQIDPAELNERTRYYLEHPDAPLPDKKNPEMVAMMAALCATGGSARRDTTASAAFSVGDRVRVINEHPVGHTKCPRYTRGRVGVVELVHGAFVYPDKAAQGDEDAKAWVYTVRFNATELWGERAADPNGSVSVDAWEPYLELV